MKTCATLGQTVGTQVFYALKNGLVTREAAQTYIRDIQNTLMDDDCYLPGWKRPIVELSTRAKRTASSGKPEALRNGVDRSVAGHDNTWFCKSGYFVEYAFRRKEQVKILAFEAQ